LGSRLHVAEDGTWVAYAQWPSREAWERVRELEPTRGHRLMREAFEPDEVFAPLLLQPIVDHLQFVPIART
jgi:hypothetical protein